MSSSSGTAPASRASAVRDALVTHGLPCALSAGVAALLTWRLTRRSSPQSDRAAMLRRDDDAANHNGMSASEFNSAAHDLVDQVTAYRANLRDRRSVKSTVEPGYLKALVPPTAPEEGESWAEIQADIERVIMPGITHWSAPGFFAYFPAFASYPSILGELLCSSLNTIGFSWIGSPASTELETQVLDWVAQMCQLPAVFTHASELGGGGCIQGTAAEAAAVALLSAKSKSLEGMSDEASEAASSRMVVYISDQTHGIIAKACKITGIPLTRLRVLPTTTADNFGLRLASVQAAMNADAAAGLQPCFLCLTIGSTSSTAIDDVRGIAEWVTQNYPQVYIHVDAAYAGSFAMLPSHRHIFDGVELVDSIGMNPHKSLLVAFDCSLFFVRARRHLLAALSLAKDGEYLRNAATDSGKVLDLKDWQLPFGRRFRSLKLWFTLRSYGQVGIRRHLSSAIANADRLKNHIRTSGGRFRLRCEPLHFGLVCFEMVTPFKAHLTRDETNALNGQLKEACNATGQIFFITTVLDGHTILRLACNGETQQSAQDCDRAWAVIEQQADIIWAAHGWSRATLADQVNTAASIAPAPAVSETVPVIDISPLRDSPPSAAAGRARVAREIYAACTTWGFFYISHHGVSEELQARLESLSRDFFRLPTAEKAKLSMSLGGLAWRGWFPCGDELTSGKPDMKEGLYLGTELPADHPMVQRGIPLHGRNLFPDDSLPELRPTVLQYIDELTHLSHLLMEAIAAALGLEDTHYFRRHLTGDPTVLFRIFNYPDQSGSSATRTADSWGVGEHTDYGVLTILKQDTSGGLQVRSPTHGWIAAPPIDGTFVCNIGDMLDRLTGGRFKSTPHRVRNLATHDRLSFPFFFDPNWDSAVAPIPLAHLPAPTLQEDQLQRWDRASVHTLSGTYGEYLLRKVGKVFPTLGQQLLPTTP